MSKIFCHAAVADESVVQLDSFRLQNDQEGLDDFKLGMLREDVEVAVESMASHWIRLYDRLESQGSRVVLSNPAKTKVIVEAKIKNDSVDSKILADLSRCKMLPLCHVPSTKTRDDRELMRHRVSLARRRNEVKYDIRAILDKHGLQPAWSSGAEVNSIAYRPCWFISARLSLAFDEP